jgi:hypothetical protein
MLERLLVDLVVILKLNVLPLPLALPDLVIFEKMLLEPFQTGRPTDIHCGS